MRFLFKSFIFLLLCSAQSFKCVVNFSGKTSTLKFDSPFSQLILDSQLTATGGAIVLRDDSTDAVLGQHIILNDSELKIGDCSTTLTGTFDPTGSDSIYLNGSSTLILKEGPLLKPIFVSGSNNNISGNPSTFAYPISLQDNFTLLSLGLKSPLNQSIYLNNGSLTLNSGLSFCSEAMLYGPGIVYANKNMVSGISGNINTQLIFRNGVILELEPKLSTNLVSTNLIFQGTGQTSVINGNGTNLTLSTGGKIVVGANHTLVLNNIFIKGLDSFIDSSISLDPTATLKLSKTALGLSQPYNHSAGSIIVFGDDCRVVSPGFDFTVSGSAQLIIDGTTLWYDTLNQPNVDPIKFTNSFTQQLLLNGGSIKGSKGQDGVSGIDAPNIETDKYIDLVFSQLTNNLDLKSSSRLFVTNSTGFTKNVVLDGQGLRIKFPQGNTKLFFIEPNTNLTVTNIIFTDFNVNTVDIGANSNLFFGDKTLIELAYPWDISRSFKISGEVTIDGHSSKITLVHDDALLVQPLAALTLKNTVIHGAPLGATGGRLRVASNPLYPTSIILDNSDLFLDTNYNFSVGTLEVVRDSRIFGDSKVFQFTSNGSIFIHSGSSLILDRTITFSYAPAPLPATNPNPYRYSKERFVYEDLTAYLHLRGSSLMSTATGILISPSANLLIEDTVAFLGTGPNPGQEFEISSQANINLLAAANLELVGNFKYVW